MRSEYACRGPIFDTQLDAAKAKEVLLYQDRERLAGTPMPYLCHEGHWHLMARWV